MKKWVLRAGASSLSWSIPSQRQHFYGWDVGKCGSMGYISTSIEYLTGNIQLAAMKGHGTCISFASDARYISGQSVARYLLSLLRLLPFWAFK